MTAPPRMNVKSRKRELASDRPCTNQSAHVDRGLVFSSLAPFALVLVLAWGKSHLTLIALHPCIIELPISLPSNIARLLATLTAIMKTHSLVERGKTFCFYVILKEGVGYLPLCY